MLTGRARGRKLICTHMIRRRTRAAKPAGAMFYDRPETLPEALALLAREPRVVLAGGTDLYPAATGAGARRGGARHHRARRARAASRARAGAGASAPAPPGRRCARRRCRRRSTRCGPPRPRWAGGRSRTRAPSRATSATPRRPPTGCRRCWCSTPRSSCASAGGRAAAAARRRSSPARGGPPGGRTRSSRRCWCRTAAAAGRSAFLKLGARRHLVISIVMVAARLEIAAGRVRQRGAGGRRLQRRWRVRLPAVEARLARRAGRRGAWPERIDAGEVAAALAPLDDMRGSAAYRAEAAAELLRRAVAELRAVNLHRPAPRLPCSTARRSRVEAAPTRRLSDVLREELGPDRHQGRLRRRRLRRLHRAARRRAGLRLPDARSAQVAGRAVMTVEGLAGAGLRPAAGAPSCATARRSAASARPGMLMAAAALLAETPRPSEAEVEAALGGVLCRCTGYRKIVAAVRDAGARARARAAAARRARRSGRGWRGSTGRRRSTAARPSAPMPGGRAGWC